MDLVIADGTVYDGLGSPGVLADVAVDGDRIVAVEPGLRPLARRVIDAGGLAVAPGFIDPHAHSDVVPSLGRVLRAGRPEPDDPGRGIRAGRRR